MPNFSYECRKCEHQFTTVAACDEKVKCQTCGRVAKRLFSPTTNLKLAPWMLRENEDIRARHRAYLDSPETQAKIKSGELAPDTSDRYTSNMDGAAASSDIQTRIEEGYKV